MRDIKHIPSTAPTTVRVDATVLNAPLATFCDTDVEPAVAEVAVLDASAAAEAATAEAETKVLLEGSVSAAAVG